jgi:hypothetical protein
VGLRDPDGRREASPGERAARLLQRAVRAPLRELHPLSTVYESTSSSPATASWRSTTATASSAGGGTACAGHHGAAAAEIRAS